LQDVCERLIKAEADRLPGGSAAGEGLELCGQVIATGRSMNALRAEGGEQIDDIDFSRRAFGEVQVLGQLAQVWLGEEDRADGKLSGGGLRRGRFRGFFDISLYNSIYTITLSKNKNHGTQNQNSASRARDDEILLC
jgi:hypothetical protein